MRCAFVSVLVAAVFAFGCGGPSWEPAEIPGSTMVPPPPIPGEGVSEADEMFSDDDDDATVAPDAAPPPPADPAPTAAPAPDAKAPDAKAPDAKTPAPAPKTP